jgi:hypothetical protein
MFCGAIIQKTRIIFFVAYEGEAGCWIMDAGYWMLDTGCWMLDARCWIEQPVIYVTDNILIR